MKKGLIKFISCMMVVIMVLTSAPLSGFVGLELSEWNLFDSLDFSAFASNKIDYSNLTESQYMAKVLLNHNYSGAANNYGSNDSTIPQRQLDFYLNPEKVSISRVLYNELRKSSSFVAGVAAWKTLTFDPSNIMQNELDEKGYYTALRLLKNSR